MVAVKMDSTQKVSNDTFGLLVAEQVRVLKKKRKRPSIKSLIGVAVEKAFGGKK